MGQHPWSAREIAANLRVEILSGQRRPGSQLATTSELTNHYRVARQTVQNAVDQLKAEGLIESRPGVGWFVCRLNALRLLRSSDAWLDRNARTSEEQAPGSWEPEINMHQCPTVASSQVASDLGLAKGADVWLRKRTVANNNRMFQVGWAYLPRDITANTEIEHLDSPASGTYDVLRIHGYQIVRFTETVSAAPAAPWEASALGLDPSPTQAVLRITRVAHGIDRRLEVDYIIARPARLQLVYELPAE